MEEIKMAILCGGKGVRLKPLTDIIPKVLIMLRGKPLLQHSLDHYSKKGINNFLLSIGYKGNMIKEHFNNINNNTHNIKYIESGDDATNVKFFSLIDLPLLAFDHDIIIQDKLESTQQ